MTDHDKQLLQDAKALSSAPLVRDLLELIERQDAEIKKLYEELSNARLSAIK